MVQYIEFTDERFNKNSNYNMLGELANNTIIICANYKLMDTFAKEICDTINGKAESNNYWCDESDIGQAKIVLNFGLQRIIDINGQHITLGLEPSIIYKATSIDDIWFIDWKGGSKDIKYEESIYPITIFIGSEEVYERGLDDVYRAIVNGRYGCYDGSWVNKD